MSGWPDGKKSRMSEVQMARCPDGRMSRWPDVQMARRPNGQKDSWPEVQMAGRTVGQKARYLDDYALYRVYKTNPKKIGVALATPLTTPLAQEEVGKARTTTKEKKGLINLSLQLSS